MPSQMQIAKRSAERNYGCRISDDYLYRGLRTVVLENSQLRVSVLVDKGCDIFEFLYKPLDIDFMYRSRGGIRNPSKYVPTISNPEGAYLDYWEGGWQEAFPIGGKGCTYKGASYGLHGEVSLMPWQHTIAEDKVDRVAAYFWVRTCRSPFWVEKVISLEGNEPILRVWERITNEGETEMDFMWGQHPVVGRPFLSSECEVTVPAKTVLVPDPADWPASRLAQGRYRWPLVKDSSGQTVDISIIASPESGIAEAAYLTDLRAGWFCLTSRLHRLVFCMSWPLEIFPWIWYWHVAGGERNAPFYGCNYCVALEPFTSYPPDFKKTRAAGTQRTLQPRESLEVEFSVSVFPTKGTVQAVTPDGKIVFS